MTKVCLNMIVKNEEAIIKRCLESMAPHIDYYVILDTGSTDKTVEIIKKTMKKARIKGYVVHGHFENFEQARNDALWEAQNSKFKFDYILLADADMVLVSESPWPDLTGHAYMLTQQTGNTSYQNIRLLRKDALAAYMGVTHEYLDVGEGLTPNLTNARFIDHANGSNRADKFHRDIALLEAGLVDEPDNARYKFYLAQSYRDAGCLQEAFCAYAKRASMGGWGEEVFYSLLQAAVCAERLGLQAAEVDGAYLAAWNSRPTRAEPLVEMARRYRERGLWHLARLVANVACSIDRPDDVLFVDEASYTWRPWDEAAIASYWTGEYTEAIWRGNECLMRGVPDKHRERVISNLNFAKDASK